MGIAKAAPWALQKPKEPKAARASHTRSITYPGYPRAAAAFRKNASVSGSRGPPRVRRRSSAAASPHPVIRSTMLMICSWKTITPPVSRRYGARSGWIREGAAKPWRDSR